MLYFGRKLDIFGDVSTHGHNWAKMRNKEKNPLQVRHKRKATSEASSSLGAAASWRTARDPSLAGNFVTMIDYALLSFMG